MRSLVAILAFCAIAAGHFHAIPQEPGFASREQDLRLWYRQPAATWNEALPIGNGRLGAMVFGGVERERLQLNEDTRLGRREARSPEPGGRGGRQGSAPAARRRQGGARPRRSPTRRIIATPRRMPPYQPLGDLGLTFAHTVPATDYHARARSRDAIARVDYTVEDTIFTREVFASAVDQAIVVRLTKERPREARLHRAAVARARRRRPRRRLEPPRPRRPGDRRPELRRATWTSARPACASPPRCRR